MTPELMGEEQASPSVRPDEPLPICEPDHVPPGWRYENFIWIAGAIGLTFPWVILRILHLHLPPEPTVIVSGLSIVGAALIVSWAAELSQLEISRSLAIIFVALVAVLPEYAVDMVYAWSAGSSLTTWQPGTPHPAELGLPMANMTGANRLLIGMGWALVTLIYCYRERKPRLALSRAVSIEYSYLLAATAYAFVIPLKGSLSIWDGLVYVTLFGLYVRKAMRAAIVEPELEGPAAVVVLLPRTQRRFVNVAMFVVSCGAIYLAAEPFAEGLKDVGHRFGIETFLLVQWLAPLASESPEFIVATIFALRGSAAMGLGALISSKVNQWTLLVGMIPMAVFVSSGGHMALPLDARQSEELLLTAAQSAFAVAILSDFSLSRLEAAGLIGLFVTQLLLPFSGARLAFSWIYLFLTMIIVFRRWEHVRQRLQEMWQNVIR